MGCPCELRLHARRGRDFTRAAGACAREINRLEQKYSRYLPDSVTTRINNAAGREAVGIDAETALLLNYADVCHRQSGGLFDITSGVFRRVWHRGRTTLPARGELEFCLARVGWSRVRRTEGEVYLPVEGMELDFGGVVKEYAADAAAAVAVREGIRHGLVNLGGDIRIVGARPGNNPWTIGITHPTSPGSAIANISLRGGALTTSGSYERFLNIEGKRYSHLVDPRTGWPVDGLLGVSVAAAQAVVAGSIASTALLQPPDGGLDWLERCGAPYLAIDRDLNCHGHLGHA